MGFQDMPKVMHQAASSKGGKVRKAKGLARLTPERRKEIATKGGYASNRGGDNQIEKKADSDIERIPVAEFFGDIDEKELQAIP